MADDVRIESPAIALAGRLMPTLIFFLSGITHFTDMARYVALMPAASPFRPFWVAISAVSSSPARRSSRRTAARASARGSSSSSSCR